LEEGSGAMQVNARMRVGRYHTAIGQKFELDGKSSSSAKWTCYPYEINEKKNLRLGYDQPSTKLPHTSEREMKLQH